MALRAWTNVDGTWNGTWSNYNTGIEWQVENSDADRIANNRSLVTVRQWIRRTSGTTSGYNLTDKTSWLEYDGGNRQNITTRWDFRSLTNNVKYYVGQDTAQFPKGAYYSFYVYHNSDGTRSLPISTSLTGSLTQFNTATVSTTITLPTIPRYAAINSFTFTKASAGAGLSRLVCGWSTDTAVDSVQYSLSGGGWVTSGTTGTSGSFNINGLTPGTSYSLKIRVKRTESQLWTESGTINQSTYAIATLLTAPSSNINVDTTSTITYNNPSGAALQCSLYRTNGSTVIADYRTCTGTSYPFTLTSGEKNNLYAEIPDSNTIQLRFYLRTADGLGNTYLSYLERTFEITNANPIFTIYDYQDTEKELVNGNTTVDLTGNPQKFIKNISGLEVEISAVNKATAVKGTSIRDYLLMVNDEIKVVKEWSETNTVYLELPIIDEDSFAIRAVDFRGNGKSVTTNLGTNLIEYEKPIITNSSVQRITDTSEETRVIVDGDFWNNNFGNQLNSITATYRYRKGTSGSWSDAEPLTVSVTGDTFSIDENIIGDTANGFDLAFSYQIEIIVNDYAIILPHITKQISSSKPLITIGENAEGMGIKTVYDPLIGGDLQTGNVKILEEIDIAGSLKTERAEILEEASIGGNYNETLGGALQVNGSLKIPSTADVSLSSTDNPIQIGPTTGANLVMDGNEIMARNNGSASQLNLNNEGGIIQTKGTFQSSGNTNRGSWNGPTVGALTQIIDNTEAQHSVIVGKRLDNGARLYGIDLYDSYSAPIMRLFAGSNSIEVSTVPKANNSPIITRATIPVLYARATINADQNISGGSRIALNTIVSSTGLLTLSNNGIKIGAGISYVRVSGCVFGQALPSGNYMWVQISKSGAGIISSTIVSIGGYFAGGSVATTIYPVQENDIFYLTADSPGGGQARGGYTNTWLEVEVIK